MNNEKYIRKSTWNEDEKMIKKTINISQQANIAIQQ